MIKLLLSLLALGKLGKVLTTGGTMIISVFAYALVFGWKYAVGFVLLLFCHEMGHFIAARLRGMDVGAPTFIPFIGAWIQLKEQPLDAETEAYIGIAGPMLGSAAAYVCYLIGTATGESIWLALAYGGFMLNLFNLIPLSPLDGGRIVGVVSPRIWLLGVPLLAALFFWKPSPMLILIAIIAAPQVWAVLKNRGMQDAAYYQVAPAVRYSYAAYYLLLAAGLALMAYEVKQVLPAH
ncbi:MAG TPA: site-2 protease family protein [Burkholderiales bacterium]|jgi:Zn-dependent protease